jgi:hypothetical protein
METSSLPIFSNADYWKDPVFQHLMLKWNVYMQSDESDDDLLSEWEELLIKDFRLKARLWLKTNKRKTKWLENLR